MNSQNEKRGVGRVFWITTAVAFVVLFSICFSTLDIGGILGQIVLGILFALMLSLLCGLLAEAISSMFQLIRSRQLHVRHLLLIALIIILCACLGLLHHHFPESVLDRWLALLVFGTSCFSLGGQVAVRRMNRYREQQNTTPDGIRRPADRAPKPSV